ncbi:MAG TPA: HD domain-containing protein [Acidisarcina sp.]|nr:HD domain-containing protein [Acidisarcina sp.]
MSPDFRSAVAAYIRREAMPEEKYGHQPRVYALTRLIGEGLEYDDDVVYAAAWLHDLGVFVGHRPEDPQKLVQWDHVAYTVERIQGILEDAGFPADKVPAVIDAIRTHQPEDDPKTIEATILRDADILEQLGAIGILRGVSKIGRDTRYKTFTSAVANLRRSLQDLPARLRLESARNLAEPKVRILRQFLEAADLEGKPELF